MSRVTIFLQDIRLKNERYSSNEMNYIELISLG
jgi:hypothetical protein